MDSKTLHADLHTALGEDLLRRVRSGEATAAELNVARQFLKDNGIDSTQDASQPLRDLTKILPFPTQASRTPLSA